MKSSADPAVPARWTSLWVVALLSLLAQLGICRFFSFGEQVPYSIDVNPSNIWKYAYHFPPVGTFQVYNWLGIASLPPPLNPFGLAANLPVWWFFTAYAPVMATLALLAMVAFLRELELPRPAALFGGVIYAWQGDLLPFVYPGHYGYIALWFFFALAAWAVLRAQRTRQVAYALISGASCGLMVGLQPDRGSIASLLIAALYLAPVLRRPGEWRFNLQRLVLCGGVALLITVAAFLALFQTYIVGVKLGGENNREQTYKLATQFSFSPEDTLTYLVPGAVGWHSNHGAGPYWGKIGQWPGWSKDHQGTRNLNLAISTTGTVATALALLGACLLLPGRWLGPDGMNERQRFHGQILLNLGLIALILSWGYHTPLYRMLFDLPLMDKWRNPIKWLEWTNFALVVLSAYGVRHLIDSLDAAAPAVRVIRRRLSWVAGTLLALLMLGWLASYPMGIVLTSRLLKEGYEALAVANILETLHFSLALATGLTALVCLLVFGLWRVDFLRGWTLVNPLLHRLWHRMLRPEYLPLTLALGLAALAALQLKWVDSQFITSVPLRASMATNPLLEQLRSQGDRVRVSVAAQDSVLSVLLQNQFYANHISCLDISAASRVPDVLHAFFQALEQNRARLWLLAGVKNVVVPQQFMPQLQHDPGIAANMDLANGYQLVPTENDLPSHALVQMRDYLAKATWVPRTEVVPEDKALLARLADPAWNPRATILLKAPASSADAPVAGARPTRVDVTTYTPQKIVIEVQSPQNGYLLVNDQYDPDWSVKVNGSPAPLLRADYILRAVAVPAGFSTVTMDYVAHYRVAGLNLPVEIVNNLCDGFMLAIWLLAGLLLWRGRNRPASI